MWKWIPVVSLLFLGCVAEPEDPATTEQRLDAAVITEFTENARALCEKSHAKALRVTASKSESYELSCKDLAEDRRDRGLLGALLALFIGAVEHQTTMSCEEEEAMLTHDTGHPHHLNCGKMEPIWHALEGIVTLVF